jgi:hypothetical protein
LRIICVEPSPDVAVAVANSFGVSVSASGYGSGSLSGAVAEGLAQIAERTTAIQAILRQGYQACIDYMNGAINGTTYSLRQSRLDDLLVTLVLAEDAAGAFGRKGASIGTNAAASAEAVASMLPDISQGLEESNKELAEKQQAVADRQQELNDAQAALDNATDENRAELTTKRDAAQTQLDIAKSERDAALRKTTGLSEAASRAAAGVTSVTGQGGIIAEPDPQIARAIADMQDTFVNKDAEQAYLSTCLIELGQWKQRDPEDDRFRQGVLRDLEGQKGGDVRDYFLATQLGQQTWLTDHCRANFDTFLLRAQENRYNLNVMKMQIEAQRVKLDELKLEKASLAIGEGVSPAFARAAAVKAQAALTEALAKLTANPVPKPAATDSAERKDAIEQLAARQQAVANKSKELASRFTVLPPETDVTNLEARLRQLDIDARQQGSDAERRDWQADFEFARSNASYLARRYDDYTREANSLTGRVSSLVDAIPQLPAQ